MQRCQDCGKLFLKPLQNLDGRRICADCLVTRVADRNLDVHVGFRPDAVLFAGLPTTSTRVARPFSSGVFSLSGSFAFAVISGGTLNLNPNTSNNNPPSNDMTMEQMLAKVEATLYLTPKEREAAKKMIRQMWGYVD